MEIREKIAIQNLYENQVNVWVDFHFWNLYK